MNGSFHLWGAFKTFFLNNNLMVSSLPLLLLAAAVLLHMPSSSVQAAEEEELTRIRLGLEWFLNADHLPLVIALREGYFREVGLDVVPTRRTIRSLRGRGGDHRREARRRGDGDSASRPGCRVGETRARFRAIPPHGRRRHAPRIRPACAGPRDMRGSDIAYPGSPGPGGPAIVQTMVEADGGACNVSLYGELTSTIIGCEMTVYL